MSVKKESIGNNLQFLNEEELKRIASLRLLDDDFMTKVFEDVECSEVLLQIILNRKDLKIQKVHVQHSIKNLQGRSVRLDIIAVDSAGKIYNVEVQRDNKGAEKKRARYNSSLLDANITEPGEEFKNLPETYIIFITENDILKGDLPIYHIDRVIQETRELFDDEEHIIYVNSQITDETELGKLMHDFRCTDAKDMYNPILAKRVSYFKEDKEGVTIMNKELEKMCDEARKQERREAVQKMLKNPKYTNEDIKEIYEITDEEIESIREEMLVK